MKIYNGPSLNPRPTPPLAITEETLIITENLTTEASTPFTVLERISNKSQKPSPKIIFFWIR